MRGAYLAGGLVPGTGADDGCHTGHWAVVLEGGDAKSVGCSADNDWLGGQSRTCGSSFGRCLGGTRSATLE